MSSWEERISDHAALEKAEQLKDKINSIEGREWDTPIRENLHRIRRAISVFTERVSRSDPELSSLSAFNVIAQKFDQISTELTQFERNKIPNHIDKANKFTDELLQQLRYIWVPESGTDIEEFKDSVGSYRRSIGQNARYAEQEFSKLKEALTDLQGEFSEAEQTIERQKERVDSIIGQFQEQFSEAQDDRSTRFSSTLDSIRSEFDSLLEQQEESFNGKIESLEKTGNELQGEFSKNADTEITRIQRLKDKAENLVHVIANTGMTGGYKNLADNERGTRRRWSGIAIGSFIGMIGFAIYAFVATVDQFSPYLFLARFGVVLTFGILATYAARQADKHHKIEKESRKIELELASLEPFLAEFEDAEKSEIRQRVAEKYFYSSGRVVDANSVQVEDSDD